MYVPIAGWMPDADSTIQGVLTDVEDMIPTLTAYAGAPTQASSGLAALAAECRGAAAVSLLDDSTVLFAGTQTKLYKAGTTTWEDVSVAGDYTGSTSSRWCFTQQGNVTLACNKVDNSQAYVHGSSTDFAAVSGMPKAALVEAVGNFVLIGNYNDGTDTVDGWGCSALGDYTDWTPSTTTLCTYGRLYDTPGPLTALKRLMDYAVYYKRKSMYLARYVGEPNAWEFSLVSDIIGAVSQESVVRVGTVHYFLGDENFYSYDTNTVSPIGEPIREWFNTNCNNARRTSVVAVNDKVRGLIYWYFPIGTSTTLNAYVVYNYRNGKWGKGTQSVETALQYVAAGYSYDDLDTRYTTYDAYPSVPYDELSPAGKTAIPAVFDTSHALKLLNGLTTSCSLTTGDFGQDGGITLLSRVRPRYTVTGTGTMTTYHRDGLGETMTTGATTSGTLKFDTLRSARWHRFKLSFTGPVELSGADVTLQAEGEE